jgi:WD40 repeat protein
MVRPGRWFVLLAVLALAFAGWSGGADTKSFTPPPRQDALGDPLPTGALAGMGTTRLRHDHSVLTVALSPDGKYVASGGNDFTIRLWERDTGKEVRRFGPQVLRANPNAAGRAAHAVAFAHDGKRLAAGLGDNSTVVWEVATGKELFRKQAHQGGVLGVAFSPDDKLLASSGVDQTIRLWELATAKELVQMAGFGQMTCLAFAPDGHTLASGCTDGTIRLWQVPKGHLLRNIEGHRGSISAVAFSPDGNLVASAGEDKIIRLWDATPAGNPQFAPLLWSAIPWGRKPGLIPILQGIEFARLDHALRELDGHKEEVKCLAFATDGQALLSGGSDQTVRIWDFRGGQPLETGGRDAALRTGKPLPGKELRRLEGHYGPVNCLALSHDGKTVVTGDDQSTIRVWEYATGKEIIPAPGHQGQVETVAFLPDGHTLLTGSRDQTVGLWEAAGGRAIRRFWGHQSAGTAVALSPDGKTVATGGADGVLRLWDPETGKELRHFDGHKGAIKSVPFSPDGKLLATGGHDFSVRLWDLAAGKEVRQVKGHDKPVAYVVFTADSRTLASGSGDETIYLWDVATGTEIRQLEETGADVDCVAWSGDARFLAAGSRDGVVRIWDVDTGTIQRQLEGHPGYVTALAYSTDGKTLAVGSWLTVRLWEVFSGKDRGRLDGQHGDALALCFSPDGRLLAAGNGGTSALIWDVTSRSPTGKLEPVTLTPKELDTLWLGLGGDDAARAYRAIWTMAADPRTSVAFLATHARPVAPLDAARRKQIAKLLADLDNEDFEVRDKAHRELEKLGDTAAPELRKVLEREPTDEVRRHVEDLLQKLQAPAKIRERLQALRANEVLEKIGSTEARQVLKSLAAGALESAITQDAKAALERLARRTVETP